MFPVLSLDSSGDIDDGHPGQNWLRLEDGRRSLSDRSVYVLVTTLKNDIMT